MPEPLSRGSFLGLLGAAGAGLTAGCAAPSEEQKPTPAPASGRTQIPNSGTFAVTLGTAGGPRPHPRSGPSTAVISDGKWHLVDCGAGTVRQLQTMGVNPADVASVWFTHHHYDHNGDYGNVLMQGWHSGRVGPLPVFGPAGTAGFHRKSLAAQHQDIEVRSRASPSEWARVAEMRPGQTVGFPGGGGGTVTCVRVTHPPIETLAFRFNTPDGSVTVSGDTAPDGRLVKLARGSDLLVHEVTHEPSLGVILDTTDTRDERERLKKHLLETHTTTADVGGVAQRANVGGLVLTHLVPSDPDAVDAKEWLRQPRRDFKGPVALAGDLSVHQVSG